MNCADVSDIARRWGNDPEYRSDAETARQMREHLDACPECAGKYGALPAFLSRGVAGGSLPADAFFADRVMDRIREADAGRVPRPVRARPAYVPLLAAAAALALFIAGFALRGLIPAGTGDLVAVSFTFNAPEARSVRLVGSFHDWSKTEGREMRRNESGQWVLTLNLRRDGVYTYNFLVDGTVWVPDPQAEEVVDDGFGGMNSLLRL